MNISQADIDKHFSTIGLSNTSRLSDVTVDKIKERIKALGLTFSDFIPDMDRTSWLLLLVVKNRGTVMPSDDEIVNFINNETTWKICENCNKIETNVSENIVSININFFQDNNHYFCRECIADINTKHQGDKMKKITVENLQKHIESLGYSFAPDLKNKETHLNIFIAQIKDNSIFPSEHDVVEFICECTEWNICDSCKTIEVSHDLKWVGDSETSAEDIQLIRELGPHCIAVCKNCLEKQKSGK